MADRILTQRALNRALLARQLLLERVSLSIDGRIELDPFEELSTSDRRAVEREREALEAFHA